MGEGSHLGAEPSDLPPLMLQLGVLGSDGGPHLLDLGGGLGPELHYQVDPVVAEGGDLVQSLCLGSGYGVNL